MSWTQEQIDNTLRTVVERSVTDPAFRTLAVKDPKAAIGQVTSTPVPAEVRIRFVESEGYDVTVVLPEPAQKHSGLRDEDLAGVAGGGGGGIDLTGGNIGPLPGLVTAACLYTKKPNSPAFCPH